MMHLPALIVKAAIMLGLAQATTAPGLPKPVESIALSNVTGRIDHMAMDFAGKRLFIAALGNGTLEVVDLAAGRRLGSVSGLKEPQGVAYLPLLKRVVVSCGGDGTCRAFDAATLKETGRVEMGEDADNIRVDSAGKLIYVGIDAGLAALDADTLAKRGEIMLAGHAESFQLEAHGDRIFANVPGQAHVAVIDRRKNEVIATWPVKEAKKNFPMALDETGHRLFIACRAPAKLVVLDTNSGATLAALDCVGDADEVFFDDSNLRVCVVGGEGFVDVFTRADAQPLVRSTHLPTRAGARTGAFLPESGTIYVAAPMKGDQPAEMEAIRIVAAK